MTANAMTQDKERADAAGMNDHVAKPIDVKALIKTLLKWIPPGERELPPEFAARLAQQDDPKPQELPPLPELPGINIEAGLARSGGNQKLYRNLLVKFHRDNQETAGQIQSAIQKGDQELAVRLAHTVKGVAGTIGAEAVQTIGGELEAVLKSNFAADHTDLVSGFEAALNSVLEVLAPVVAAMKNNETKQGNTKQGDLQQLSVFLEQLIVHVKKRKPKPCKEIMAEMKGFSWPAEFNSKLGEIEKLVGKYKFKEAAEIVSDLTARAGTLFTGHPIQQGR